MKFAHLIEINDPSNSMIAPLSRAQLWRGLMLRAMEPMTFVPHLDACELVEQSAQHLARRLRFGELIVSDTVRFETLHKVIYDVPAQSEMPASRLVMTIEEPAPQALFVRFEYENDSSPDASAENAMYEAYRRAAYQEADIDTIVTVRKLAQEGLLGD